MEPKARDLAGATALVIVLVALVVLIVLAALPS
jgi:preprotein translocase subunit SecE